MYSQYVVVVVPLQLHTARIACWFSKATTHWSNFCTRDGIDSQTVLRTIRKSKSAKLVCFWSGDKAFKPVKKSMNYETLQIRKEKIAQNAFFKVAFFCRASSIKKSKYCCHPPFYPPPPPSFSLPFLKTFVTHPPNINDWILLSPRPLSYDPDTPQNLERALRVQNLIEI